jgi:CRP/FNR family transcriptional regulator, anaerobic regulatory protein
MAKHFKSASPEVLAFIEKFNKHEVLLSEKENVYLEGDTVKFLYTLKSG